MGGWVSELAVSALKSLLVYAVKSCSDGPDLCNQTTQQTKNQ